ncbi:MAG: hypothetical protein K0R15_2231 [Clostridiales bacterium]|jgi:predicted metal-dependent phosphoesterase TrpH|nr:hypothetical protein [Clostridiales bacterium]
MGFVDLHVHSTASDGTLSPVEVVQLAKKVGLSSFALTDHDTVSGVAAAIEEGNRIGVEVISGIEFSTDYYNTDVHILGLFVDHTNKEFLHQLIDIQDSRENRNYKMIEKLNELGYEITFQELIQHASDTIVTRAHFARVLIDKGYAKTNNEVFDTIIGKGCPAYIPRAKVTPKLAIDLIKLAGGVSVLAHPMIYGLNSEQLNELVAYLKGIGLEGIEALYGLNSEVEESDSRRLARIYDLKMTGGSDYHGKNKSSIELGTGKGNLRVSSELLETLRP